VRKLWDSTADGVASFYAGLDGVLNKAGKPLDTVPKVIITGFVVLGLLLLGILLGVKLS
jgi:hypothetical protein